MADLSEREIEHAEWLTDRMRDEGLYQVRKALEPESDPDFESPWCIGCGNEIPPERLALKRIRCVHCQRVKEFREKMGLDKC